MITRKQALNARHWLQGAESHATVAHYAVTEHSREWHLNECEKEFAIAAEKLGFKLIRIEDNQLKVIEATDEQVSA